MCEWVGGGLCGSSSLWDFAAVILTYSLFYLAVLHSIPMACRCNFFFLASISLWRLYTSDNH